MADYVVEERGPVDVDANGPIYRVQLEVAAGASLADDVGFAAEIGQTVPAGKKMLVHVMIRKTFVDA